MLFTPLAMLIVGDLLGITTERSRAFSFIYGMLPSAPTVIVFAREFGQPSETLAALQFLCLLLAVPFLFVSTAALQLPMIVGDEASRPSSNHDRTLTVTVTVTVTVTTTLPQPLPLILSLTPIVPACLASP